MKAIFSEIKEQLEDPFFEIRTLGKEAIRQRTLPMDKYGDAPDNLLFIDWMPDDDHETIQYSFQDTELGRLLLANTPKGLCFLGIVCKNEAEIKTDFTRRFPQQPMVEEVSEFQMLAVEYCNGNHELTIPLHMKGTTFQIGIWKQLLRIPEGRLSTYGSLSDDPGAAQAVGSAVGANPVSYIVPCHRIVKNDGSMQGYHWGTDIKKQLLAYELQP
ncbi:methylated-DNA--[protein]-cysteine S-methyltransferase [Bacteroides sp. 51]|uniref:methylated-DNA--[protein]-cysteine S-methyltransferase n=1 Tax=Bacteroides sp. 51 TaxID=2302938 RepID=UPI0013D0FDB1|nr:methylated-DNA--[protein]-cysteine S-methyltransferase [Bacteroides sp. 51]NDV84028.1 methylated-DNA--[protein]-cysteine S-methyltransferase [Bacteroides sp. 51]